MRLTYATATEPRATVRLWNGRTLCATCADGHNVETLRETDREHLIRHYFASDETLACDTCSADAVELGTVVIEYRVEQFSCMVF